jgi:hypothetical protein
MDEPGGRAAIPSNASARAGSSLGSALSSDAQGAAGLHCGSVRASAIAWTHWGDQCVFWACVLEPDITTTLDSEIRTIWHRSARVGFVSDGI